MSSGSSQSGETPPRPQAGPPPTSKEVRANKWAEEAVRTRLPRIRSLAEKWMGTTATITGLFGAGTILGAGDSVATMQGWYRVGFGVLVALTLLAAACAIVCAFTASQPEIQPIPAELSKRVALHEQAFDRAVSNLTKSRWLAAAAVVLLIAAVAVLWYAPRTPTETQESSTAPGRSSLSQYRTAAPIDGVRPPLRTWLKAV